MIRTILITAIVVLTQAGSAFAETDGARKFIEKVSSDTIAIVKSDISNEEKEQQITKLFEDVVDTKWMARFVMGRYWNEANDEQKKKYTDLYHKFVLSNYVPLFREYNDEKIVVKSVSGDSDNEFTIYTEIKSEGDPTYRVDYKVKKDSQKYQIFDIVAEGISMITTQRSDFGSILSRGGIKDLVKRLKAKVS